MTNKKTMTNTKTKTMTMTKTNTFQRAPPKSDPRDLRPLRHLIRAMRKHDMTKKNYKDKYKDKDNDKDKDILRTPPQSNPRDL